MTGVSEPIRPVVRLFAKKPRDRRWKLVGTFDTDEVDFSTLTLTHRVLKYRNWDGAFAPLPRDTFSEKRHKLLPLGGFAPVGSRRCCLRSHKYPRW